MSGFDLLFVLVFLSTATTLIVILVNLFRGRKHAAVRVSRALGTGLASYLLVVAAVAALAPQKVLTMGEDRCFDEMCFAATGVKKVPVIGQGSNRVRASGSFYLVSVRVSSHSRGRAQSEAGVKASLIDSEGHVYQVSPQGQRAYESGAGPSPPLTSRLQPGETISSVQIFDVPQGTSDLALHFGHDGPGLFIIGDDESPLHKPTITQLEPK